MPRNGVYVSPGDEFDLGQFERAQTTVPSRVDDPEPLD
jgi:hypothetical protein